jgi:pimeloyl-ACP methyl ester carboxylesterase
MANPSPKMLLGIAGAIAGAAVGVVGGVAAIKAIKGGDQAADQGDETRDAMLDAGAPPSSEAAKPTLVHAHTLAREDSTFIMLDDLDVHVIATGECQRRLESERPAPADEWVPVVLIHGIAASVVTWRPLVGALDEQLDFVAFDRPGFGLTERPLPTDQLGAHYDRDGGPYTLERSVSLVWHLVDRLGAQRVILVGHSQGGTIAAMAAIRHPERVAALVLEAPALDLAIPNVAFGALNALHLGGIGSRLVQKLEQLDDRYFAYVWHDTQKIDAATIEAYREPTQIDRWHDALWEHVRTFRMPKFGKASWAQLAEIPVLLVTGEQDRIVPSVATHQAAQRLRDAGIDVELAVVSACGHIAHEEQMGEFAHIFRAFLRRHGLMSERPAA